MYTTEKPQLKDFSYPISKTVLLALLAYFGLHAWKSHLALEERKSELRSELDERLLAGTKKILIAVQINNARADLDATIAAQQKPEPQQIIAEPEKSRKSWFSW